MDGYIKLHRKIFDHKDYFKEKFDKIHAWIDLLLLASHQDDHIYKRDIKVMIKRGQIALSINELSTRWKWCREKTEKFIVSLENEQQIIRQKSNVTTLISIVNYNLYQTDHNAKPNAEPNAEKEQNHNAKNVSKTRPSSYTLSNQLLFQDNEPVKTIEQAVIWPTFEDFWHEYDKKVGRPKAEQKWIQLTQIEKEKIMQFIPKYKQAAPDKQYRKNPESFFNNKTWNDELITSTNGTTNKQQQALEDFLKPIGYNNIKEGI